MSRKKKLPEIKERTPLFDDLSASTKQAIAAVIVGVVGIFFLLSLFSYAGMAGGYVELTLKYLFGTGAWLSPLACFFYVYALLKPRDDNHISVSKLLGIALFFFTILAALGLYSEGLGGFSGMALAYPFTTLFGEVVTSILLFAFT